MRLQKGRSPADWRADLAVAAERCWGPDRAAELASAIDVSAQALWRLAEAPLEPLDGEPDFVSGGAVRET